ncbi:MAG: type IV pilus modification PilV family protein [Gammaproteobacteria bacterium]
MSNVNKRPFLQQGFSLLEILVAFAILSLFLGVLLNIFSGGVRGADVTGQYARAVQVAESVLASVGHDVALETNALSGVTDGIYRWTLIIEPFTPPEADWQAEKSPLQAYQIRAIVTWASGLNERQFVLASLRLAPAKKNQ